MRQSLMALTVLSAFTIFRSLALAQEEECPSCATELKYVQEDVDLDSDVVARYGSNILSSRYSFRLVISQGDKEIYNQVIRPKLSEKARTSSIHDVSYVSKSTYNSVLHKSYLETAKVKQGVSFEALPVLSIDSKSSARNEITLAANIEHYSVGVLQISSDGEEGDEAKPDTAHVVQAVSAQVDLAKSIQQETPVWSSNLGSADTRYTIYARAF